MVVQTLPDQFYHILMMAGFMLVVTGRAWHLALLITDKHHYMPGDRQWKRYVYAAIGLVPSLALLMVLLVNYTPTQVFTGLNEMVAASPVYGVALWAVLVLHVLTVPFMLAFVIWIFLHPLRRMERLA